VVTRYALWVLVLRKGWEIQQAGVEARFAAGSGTPDCAGMVFPNTVVPPFPMPR
jgi:hypothetical protein